MKFLFAILVTALLLVGCIGNGNNLVYQRLAESQPQVQEFLQNYPNATITVAYLDEAAFALEVNNFTRDCSRAFVVKPYYKVLMTSQDVDAVTLIDEATQKVACAIIHNKRSGAIVNDVNATVPAQANSTQTSGTTHETQDVINATSGTTTQTGEPTPATEEKINETKPVASESETSTSPPTTSLISTEGRTPKGSADAPVTVIEYSDPSCPFCAAAAGFNAEVMNYLRQRDSTWEAPMPAVIRDYIPGGKVKIVFKYYPGHGKGADAAKIMWCSGEQGKFWEVHDAMFTHQDLMEANDVTGLKKVATDLGVNADNLNTCLASGKYETRIQSDTAEATALGLQGTPTFYVNGRAVEGAVSYSTLRKFIESEIVELAK
ncbi:MAG: thioredoxin domain-containing protein [Candidatus Micrarchaeota archaeon]